MTESWQKHLSAADSGRIHLLPPALADDHALRRTADDLGFRIFIVNATKVRELMDLFTAFDAAIRFPPYFGWNWNALIDVLTDFSWDVAPGYLVVVRTSDSITMLTMQEQATFIDVCHHVISFWRDERGESDERDRPVPFHFIVVGNENLWTLPSKERSEICLHTAPQGVL